jgi:hypothetical protein
MNVWNNVNLRKLYRQVTECGFSSKELAIMYGVTVQHMRSVLIPAAKDVLGHKGRLQRRRR